MSGTGTGTGAGAGRPPAVRICPACARRTWLLERLAGHLDRVRERIGELLELGEGDLVAAVAGRDEATVARELASLEPAELRHRIARAGLGAVCRCDPAYPRPLLELPAPPAVLHLTDAPERLAGLLGEPAVGLVGSRRASAYGLDAARRLAAGAAGAGLTVLSGLALGIDGAAHRGALDADGATVAVLPGGADVVYPAAHRRLLERLGTRGLAVSELGPGVAPRRWMFPARNRIIAALAQLTVVVQAEERSGALITAGWAARLGRALAAVPGPVTMSLSAGPHDLLREGATLVASAQDILDAVYGIGAVRVPARSTAGLEPAAAALLEALAAGQERSAAFALAGLDAEAGLAALAHLELAGLVQRGPGGHLSVR